MSATRQGMLLFGLVVVCAIAGWFAIRTPDAPEAIPDAAPISKVEQPVVAKPVVTMAVPQQPEPISAPVTEFTDHPVAAPPSTVIPAGGALPPPALEVKLPPLPAVSPVIQPPVIGLEPGPVPISPPSSGDVWGIALPTVPQAPTGPQLNPLARLPDGAVPVYVNKKRVGVDYEVTAKGASGLSTMELWVKDASGWSRVADKKPGEPLDTELTLDGVYGLKVVPVSGQGVRGVEPKKDANPDLWVMRDTTAPEVGIKVTPVSPTFPANLPNAFPFVVELTMKDANLACESLVVEWGDGGQSPFAPLFTGKDLAKERIETKIGVFVPRKVKSEKAGEEPKMILDWSLPPDVPPRVNFTITVKDKAGNVGSAGQTNLGTDLTAPAARVTGVRGLMK